jgi:hypothetical protein
LPVGATAAVIDHFGIVHKAAGLDLYRRRAGGKRGDAMRKDSERAMVGAREPGE